VLILPIPIELLGPLVRVAMLSAPALKWVIQHVSYVLCSRDVD
jgi:hypothetical protein